MSVIYVSINTLYAEKLYIREYTSNILRKNWSQGYCVQTALNTSFALLLLQQAIRRQLCICFVKVSCLIFQTNQTYSLYNYKLFDLSA